jgi:hypothetical protein
MFRLVKQSFGSLLLLVFLPAAALAQAAITGVVKDASGGVLPGVTVEAASPVLIEKVRSVVSDDTGQYRIVNLRPGTYSVTFSLPGFSSVKREGIELTGTFVATINGELKVGALEETITVTGETPIVDVQSAKQQQTVSKDVLAAIPSSRNAAGIQSLIPGMSNSGDSGGISGGMTGSAGSIHGGRANDSRTYNDGINTGWAGGNGGGGNTPNVAGAQEVVVSTSGGLGEAEAAGVILNVIPREGGNTFSGSFNVNGARGGMQGDNYTQSLQDRGLKSPAKLITVYDVNPMGGGRIIRDKLWFYLTYRQTGGSQTVPGMWVNTNATNPNAWAVSFDKSQPAFTDTLERNGIGRITWQITPRNKLNLHWSEQYTTSSTKGGGTATQTIEATGRTLYQPSHIQQASWSSPISGKLLLEAGWGTYQARYRNPSPRTDGLFNPLMIRQQEQVGQIPGLFSRMPGGAPGGGYNNHLIGTLANARASMSYVTGAHNMKFGYQGGFNNPSQQYYFFNPVILVRTSNGVPNQITETISQGGTPGVLGPGSVKYVRNLVPTSLYGQDQWTTGRLTLQGGVRYDHILTSYPDSSVGGPGWLTSTVVDFPSRSTQGVHWSDITPRLGASYDVFGNGKTAVKFNLGKYMEAFSATNTDLDLNPLIRVAVSTTRPWLNPTNFNFNNDPKCVLTNPLAQPDCGAMANQTLGQATFTRSYDPDYVTGWGHRPYNWGLGVQLQQEVLPRVSVNLGYFRNWWGNWYIVDNRSTSVGDYTPFSVAAPLDPRLPNGGGYAVSGLYDLIPGRIGQKDEIAEASSKIGSQVENWQGIDVTVTARLRNGLTVQGGTSSGRRLVDSCAIRAQLPELGAGPDGGANSSIVGLIGTTSAVGNSSVTNPYCRIVEPYLTSIRGLAAYTIPKVNVQVSGTFQSNPGPGLAANYVANNAAIAAGPQPLGRALSGGANVTVNLITPATLYGDRINQLDLRVAKILRYGRTRTQVGIDVYNALNSDTPLTYNNTFVPGGTWLTPLSILAARFAKVGVQFDF